jgi:hypothetical protein
MRNSHSSPRCFLSQEIYDIGSIVPVECEAFFRASNFEQDREQSQTMTFGQHYQWQRQGLVPGLAPSQQAWVLAPQRGPGRVITRQGDGCGGRSNSGVNVVAGHNGSSMIAGEVACDPLAAVPTPATCELQRSDSLRELLLRKMDAVLLQDASLWQGGEGL